MKLLQKTNIIYLIFSAIMMLTAGVVLYFILTHLFNDELNEKLLHNKTHIINLIKQNKQVYQYYPDVEVKEINVLAKQHFIIKDTILFDSLAKEEEPFREINSMEIINGKFYQITVRDSLFETEDFLFAICSAIGYVFIAILVGLFFINRRISRKLWHPFYKNLETLKNFSIQEKTPVMLQSSGIIEFQELNSTILKLTNKIRSDYHILKEFTENASHEMQTPLAIIQLKLEMLLQSPTLDKDQAQLIKAVYSSTQRLSKLNQTLLLLSKIENHQFIHTENIQVEFIIKKQIEYFTEFFEAKNIKLDIQINSPCSVKANAVLIDILFSNLISNSVKHNIFGGMILIELKENNFKISNSGNPLTILPEKLFERFSKNDPTTTSLGLGLSIVKKICDTYGWKISYIASDDQHDIRIKF